MPGAGTSSTELLEDRLAPGGLLLFLGAELLGTGWGGRWRSPPSPHPSPTPSTVGLGRVLGRVAPGGAGATPSAVGLVRIVACGVVTNAAVAAAAARSGTGSPQGKAVPDEQDPAWDVCGTTVRYPLGDGSVYRVNVRELRPDVWTSGGEVAVCRPS